MRIVRKRAARVEGCPATTVSESPTRRDPGCPALVMSLSMTGTLHRRRNCGYSPARSCDIVDVSATGRFSAPFRQMIAWLRAIL